MNRLHFPPPVSPRVNFEIPANIATFPPATRQQYAGIVKVSKPNHLAGAFIALGAVFSRTVAAAAPGTAVLTLFHIVADQQVLIADVQLAVGEDRMRPSPRVAPVGFRSESRNGIATAFT
jgi:hypothetical protein